MFSTLPPTGIPFTWGFVLGTGGCDSGAFEKSLSEMFGCKTYLTDSGKSALYLVLKAARALHPHKQEVIVPDYTCWSVPSAIVKAGLKVHPVDIDPNTLSLAPGALEQAVNDSTLAVIHAHLFGIPGAIDNSERICHEQGVILIDDAAQGMGAAIDGQPLGSYGDVGILSFGRGKTITTLHGGAALIRNSDLANNVEKIYREECLTPSAGDIAVKLQLAAYKILFSRYLYWVPDSLPLLKLGNTVFDSSFPATRLAENLAARGMMMLDSLSKIVESRNRCATLYETRLRGAQSIALPTPVAKAKPAFIRFPVKLTNVDVRRYILEKGHNLGISAMYPGTVSSIGALKPYMADSVASCPEAENLAKELVTLPVHHKISERDIRQVCDFLVDMTGTVG